MILVRVDTTIRDKAEKMQALGRVLGVGEAILDVLYLRELGLG